MNERILSALARGMEVYYSAPRDTGTSPRTYGENKRMTKKKRKVRKSGK